MNHKNIGELSRNSLIVVMVFFVVFGTVVYGAKIDVTTTRDNVEGSLRAAITMANTNNENDTIYLPAGTYILGGKPNENANAGGDLDINNPHKITIIGDGYATTIIDGSQIDRVLHIMNGTVSMTGITIRKGKTSDGDFYINGVDGGGIYNNATLILNNCCISKNRTGGGGCGILIDVDDDIHGYYGGGDGGGIYNNGKLTINNCLINNNITGSGGSWFISVGDGGDGGGLYNNGTLDITNSSINNNITGDGVAPEIIIDRIGIPGYGGGICNYGDLTIINSIINDNITGSSSGINNDISQNGGGGGGILNKGLANLKNCTISNNETGNGCDSLSVDPGEGGYGGGIFNWGPLFLKSCTISLNKTGRGGSGGYDNNVFNGKGGNGGGIYNYNQTVRITNTIFADNQVSEEGEGPDCWGYLYSFGHNLIEDISHVDIYGSSTGNITGVDPLLASLADNGGPTKTCALLTGSPAIDAGYSAGLSEDQRGITRPIDIPGIANASDGADIGAYEFNPSFVISGTVTYGETGLANVTLTFSNNGGTTTTNNDGYYSHNVSFGWSGTVTPSKQGYTFTPANKSYTSVTSDQTHQDYTASPIISPGISLNRNQLNFGVDNSGNQSPSQTFLITNSGGGILYWTISDNASWLSCKPTTGKNSGEVIVSVDASGLAAGTYYGTITVNAPNTSNSPQYVDVELLVYKANTTGVPFGYFETPKDGACVHSSIPVTGWTLDDIGVEHVKIYRQQGKDLVYIGTAVFVEGARPDVELAYPNYPNCYKAGWGYMMLTNFLPNGGNGTFKIHAIATDREGHQVTLGTKTILCDNANAVKPFGAIDTPSQGGTASGSKYRNQGWVLTPLPNKIPEDGHTIIVWINGVNKGHPIYNIYRKDIAALFPGYANSSGAMAYFDFDTTAYENGVHTIQWTAVDNAGNVDGIGSRYFTVQNTGGSAASTAQSAASETSAFNVQPSVFNANLSQVSPDYSSPIRVKKGYNQNIEPHKQFPDETGSITIEIKELERLQIHLSEGTRGLAPLPDSPGLPTNNRMGSQVVGEQLRALPIGSTFNPHNGIFSWTPGPGFIGTYRFVFLEENQNREWSKTFITVNILPKFTRIIHPLRQ